MLQVADSFIEDAGLNEEDEEGRDEEIEVPGFVLFFVPPLFWSFSYFCT